MQTYSNTIGTKQGLLGSMRNITDPINDKLLEPTNGVRTLGDLSVLAHNMG